MQLAPDITREDLEVLTDVLTLAIHTTEYKNKTLIELYNDFIEPIKNGSFKLVRDNEKNLPIAFTAWAFVDDKVLKAIKKEKRSLKVEEFNSGDNLLFIDFFSTNEYYWDFFDLLTEYFKNEYDGDIKVDTSKIFTRCGLQIGFDGDNPVIKQD